MKLASGVKLYEPSALIVIEPTPAIGKAEPMAPGTPLTVKAETVSGLPSTSLALASRPVAAGTVRVVSSVTVLLSLPSTGASLTGTMVSVSVEVSVPPSPSETV